MEIDREKFAALNEALEPLRKTAISLQNLVATGPVPVDDLIEMVLAPPREDAEQIPAPPGYHELKMLHEIKAEL